MLNFGGDENTDVKFEQALNDRLPKVEEALRTSMSNEYEEEYGLFLYNAT